MTPNELGLVPGKVIKTFDVYRAGTVCGFEPTVAQRLVAKGLWRPLVAETAAKADAAVKEQQVEDETGSTMMLVAVETGTIQIPQNWREQHHKTKKAWAAQIAGKEIGSVSEADAVIAEAVKDQEEEAPGE